MSFNEIPEVDSGQAEELYATLREHLRQSREGQQIITAFEKDPEKGSEALADYLRKQLPEDEDLAAQIANALGEGQQITTIVSGGEVDQIVNIARLGVLNLTIERSVFGSVRQVVTVILFALAVIVLLAGGFWYSRQPRKMPEDDFNIAIAQFGQIADNGDIVPSSTATEISNALFRFMDSELNATDFGMKVNVFRKNIPLITDGDKQAEDLSKKTNADIVIYGEVDVYDDSGAADFLPRFFVAENPDTDEITGHGELANPIEFELPIRHSDEINTMLRRRAAILTLFTQGLVYLSADDDDAASRIFREAIIEAENHGSFDGQEVLHLLLGISYRKDNEFEKAEESFDNALNINPDYARAYIGKGNINYTKYFQSYDEEFALQALEDYEKALELEEKYHQEGAYIHEKVNVALGNTIVVQAQGAAGPELFERAIDHYSRVTERYEKTPDERIKGLAAIAYFGLGAAYERQNDLTKAAEAYCSSKDLIDNEDFRLRVEEQLNIIRGTCQ